MTPGMAVPTLALLAGCAGWTIAEGSGWAPGWYLAVTAVATVIQTEVFRRLDLPGYRWISAGEIAALLVVPVVGFALAIGDGPSALLAGVVTSMVVWLLAQISLTDIESITQPTDSVEGMSTPTGRLRGRFLWLGAVLSVAVVAAAGGLLPPAHARTATGAYYLPYLGYWLVGLLSLALTERNMRMARWQRERSVIDSDVSQRWAGGAATWLGGIGVLAVGILLLAAPLLGYLHMASAWVTSGVMTLAGVEQSSPVPSPVLAEPGNPMTPPVAEEKPVPNEGGPLSDLLLLTGLATIFASAYVLLARARRARPPEVRRVGQFLSAVGAVFAAVWRALLSLLKLFKRNGGGSVIVNPTVQPRIRSAWVPGDPQRRRIAAEFAAYLAAARSFDSGMRPDETPIEFGRRSGPGGSEAAVSLARGYSLARYSIGEIDQSAVEQVIDARRAAEADLVGEA